TGPNNPNSTPLASTPMVPPVIATRYFQPLTDDAKTPGEHPPKEAAGPQRTPATGDRLYGRKGSGGAVGSVRPPHRSIDHFLAVWITMLPPPSDWPVPLS
ncbi:MAG: hypothetical protein OEX04_12125, partial [Acidimicrobiia bacterium]|nr:hypothetical protein [Acidimicrobiia bacterium]